jgi:hypothetical protein
MWASTASRGPLRHSATRQTSAARGQHQQGASHRHVSFLLAPGGAITCFGWIGEMLPSKGGDSAPQSAL